MLGFSQAASSQQITTAGEPARLDIRESGGNSLRITLKPLSFEKDFPSSPAILERPYPKPVISLRKISGKVEKKAGNFFVEISDNPLSVKVTNKEGEPIQRLTFRDNGHVDFSLNGEPVLGMGEGGPRRERGSDWRNKPIEFDRLGRLHKMEPRWQSGAYGSRNPVPMMVGTGGWALYMAHPWGQIDLRDEDKGTIIPLDPANLDTAQQQTKENQHENRGKGIPPIDQMVPGLFDFFVFDAHEPEGFMKDVAQITGHAAMPPKWALGYMQSHRTLEDDEQMVAIVDSFRRKEIPVDAVIYLGTGFCPRGWNKEQPSFEFNPGVFDRKPEKVLDDMHDLHVKVVVHMVPYDRDKLPTLHGTIPPEPGETVNQSHIKTYWEPHDALMEKGIDAFWPDEGDWFNLYERMKRHQMYYQGPLSTRPNERPWSLHRNGHLGMARWGAWVWSGDTQSAWKTLEGQIAVGINHSLSLSPFWGSDIGGFYPSGNLTGEMYARWFQFGAFCPSFRSHGRTWWTRLPWGWGQDELGPLESNHPPNPSHLNDPRIEPIAKQYAELRYRLMPYTYTLAWQARHSGMPMMRAMWLHYPEDAFARDLGDQYLWGRHMLIAPVYEEGATSRKVYLPEGTWYDWWSQKKMSGKQTVNRDVDLTTMPIYVKAGAIIPLDPVRQYTGEIVEAPTTLKLFRGADGQFSWYQDDGISQDYLAGKYTLTRITWDDQSETLTIEPGPSGKSSKADEARTLRIETIPDHQVQEITYRGKKLQINL